jgi:nucleoside-diphosphate-sugar epimerase
MRIFVAGASGAIGQQLLPRLVGGGHQVAGMMRTAAKVDLVRSMGATPVVADALDPAQVQASVTDFAPDVIVHELTDLKGLAMQSFERDFAVTNRLRTEGTDHLLAAGRSAGVARFVTQSYAGWPFARTGSRIKTEEEPLDPNPVPPMRAAFQAIAYAERATLAADWTEGIVLRYGSFYGPGTGLDVDGEQLELVRKRRWPIVGDGQGVWSFIHVADAAEATLAAIERGSRGIYHVVDDEPAPMAEWLPVVAARLGAKPPMRLPRWLGRVLAGEAATVVMTEIRGASNVKARRELGWAPRYSWRESLGARNGGPPASAHGRQGRSTS